MKMYIYQRFEAFNSTNVLFTFLFSTFFLSSPQIFFQRLLFFLQMIFHFFKSAYTPFCHSFYIQRNLSEGEIGTTYTHTHELHIVRKHFQTKIQRINELGKVEKSCKHRANDYKAPGLVLFLSFESRIVCHFILYHVPLNLNKYTLYIYIFSFIQSKWLSE